MNIKLNKSAKKQLSKLDKHTQRRILSELYKLRDNPELVDMKKIKTSAEKCRIRVGDYRVIISVDKQNKVFRVIEVGHRREVYRD